MSALFCTVLSVVIMLLSSSILATSESNTLRGILESSSVNNDNAHRSTDSQSGSNRHRHRHGSATTQRSVHHSPQTGYAVVIQQQGMLPQYGE